VEDIVSKNRVERKGVSALVPTEMLRIVVLKIDHQTSPEAMRKLAACIAARPQMDVWSICDWSIVSPKRR
jgi:hypothetical protein